LGADAQIAEPACSIGGRSVGRQDCERPFYKGLHRLMLLLI
jgi:hypothetical protein